MNLVLETDFDRATSAEGDVTVGHWDVPNMDVSTGDSDYNSSFNGFH